MSIAKFPDHTLVIASRMLGKKPAFQYLRAGEFPDFGVEIADRPLIAAVFY